MALKKYDKYLGDIMNSLPYNLKKLELDLPKGYVIM